MSQSLIKKHIFLSGFMGAGKSKIGPIAANRLNCTFYDSDEIIEEACGKKIFEIFNDEGEDVFRKREQAVIFQLIEKDIASVIALGGGALNNKQTKEKVEKSGIVVYLKSSPQAIFDRIKHTTKRPLLQIDRDENFETNLLTKISDLLNRRRAIYESAHIIIERDGLEPDQVVDVILEKLREKGI